MKIVRLPLLVCLCFPCSRSWAAEKPNILFLLSDDHSYPYLGGCGSRFHQTPNLDRLVARGVKWTQAYAAHPLCSPTRSSVLTGLWPARTGIPAPVCHLPRVVLEKQLVRGNRNMPAHHRVPGRSRWWLTVHQYTTWSEKWKIGFPVHKAEAAI